MAIAAGAYHNLVVRQDGSVWAWGANDRGELGDGTTTPRGTPVAVGTGFGGVVAVTAGYRFSLALKKDGTAWAWGENSAGMLGDGAVTARQSPVEVSAPFKAVALSAAGYHSMALDDEGKAWVWGYNYSGILGDGTDTNRLTPALVDDPVHGFTVVEGGVGESFAIRQDGRVWSWGDNTYGGLGDGTTELRTAPVEVLDVTEAVSVSAGLGYALALTADGSIWSWGYNEDGRLGDGTVHHRRTPVRISEPGFRWKVATPRLSPDTLTSNVPLRVDVFCDTAGAAIHYTTDGADPTEADPTISSGSFLEVERTLTLKAKAWKTGMPESNVNESAYTLKVADPAFSLPAGIYNAPQTVSIASSSPGALIHYTTD